MLRPLRDIAARHRPVTPDMPYKKMKNEAAPVFVTNSLDEWLLPEGYSFQALLLPRQPFWRDYQLEIDGLSAAVHEDQMHQTVLREEGKDPDFQQRGILATFRFFLKG